MDRGVILLPGDDAYRKHHDRLHQLLELFDRDGSAWTKYNVFARGRTVNLIAAELGCRDKASEE